MEHSFDIDFATRYGIVPAILIKNIYFWIQKNKANEKNYYDGNYWTYNSTKAFSELFPYLTNRQISYALQKLIDEGILITGNYNQSKYDRTLWYAITDYGVSILQNCQMEERKMLNGNTENVEPIPYINTDVKTTDVKQDKKKRETFVSLIDGFTQNEELRDSLKDYVDMRKKMSKGFTTRALKQNLNELNKLASDDLTKNEIVNQSINKTWKAFYELKTNKKQSENELAF